VAGQRLGDLPKHVAAHMIVPQLGGDGDGAGDLKAVDGSRRDAG
jgi:hypothetical protein